MKSFKLQRFVDISGISGIGIIARGVIWDDGEVCLHWECGPIHSTTIYHNLEEVRIIHGHDNSTIIILDKNEELKQ